MRDVGATSADVWRLVLPWLGIDGVSSLGAALPLWAPAAGPRGPITLDGV